MVGKMNYLSIEELEMEISIVVMMKDLYFETKDKSPFSNLMFQYWCGVEIGLCLASGKLKTTTSEHYYGMPYDEYVLRCAGFFYWEYEQK